MAWLAPIACWALGMTWVWWPQLSSRLALVPDLQLDPRLVNYTLEHGYRWWIGRPPHASFWDAPLFYPQRGVTAYTDVLIGAGPPYWLLRALGAAPDTAFQGWMGIACSLNFAVGYGLVRRGLGASRAAACAAALLLAFGGAQVVHVWHPQLLPMFYVYGGAWAIAALLSSRNRERPRTRRAAFAALCATAALQLWTAFYPFFFFGLFGSLVLLAGLCVRDSRARLLETARADWRFALAALALGTAAIAPLVLRYLATAEALGVRPYMARFVPRPASWLLLGVDSYAWGWLQRPGGPFAALGAMEHGAGVGVLTASVGLAALWCARRRPGAAVWLGAALALIALSTTFGGWSLWRAVHAAVPGAAAIRVPSRIPMVLALVVAVGLAFAVDALRARGRAGTAALLVALCLAEQLRAPLPQIPKSQLRERAAGIAARLSPECRAFLAVYVGPPGYAAEDDDAAWASLRADLPTVNGRYGNVPSHWRLQKHQSDGSAPDPRRLRAALDRWLARSELDPASVCWVEYR